MQPIKESFQSTGVTICSDGWSDVHNRPLHNMLSCSPRGEMFLYSVDTSGAFKTVEYIADEIEKAIIIVGEDNVVQVCQSVMILPSVQHLLLTQTCHCLPSSPSISPLPNVTRGYLVLQGSTPVTLPVDAPPMAPVTLPVDATPVAPVTLPVDAPLLAPHPPDEIVQWPPRKRSNRSEDHRKWRNNIKGRYGLQLIDPEKGPRDSSPEDDLDSKIRWMIRLRNGLEERKRVHGLKLARRRREREEARKKWEENKKMMAEKQKQIDEEMEKKRVEEEEEKKRMEETMPDSEEDEGYVSDNTLLDMCV